MWKLKVVEAYIIDADLNKEILDNLSTDAFVDPVIQNGYVDSPCQWQEIGPLR